MGAGTHRPGAAPDERFEIKLVCEEVAYHRLMSELRLHHVALRPQYPPRRVQSLYLDTHEGRAVEDHLAGISDRAKIRFRWYGDASAGVSGTLERKVRRERMGHKELLRLPDPVDVEGVGRLAFVRSLRARATPHWRELLAPGLEPAQWISYRREYLTTADRAVRVTVDRKLTASDQRHRAVLSPRHATPLPGLTIVECKATHDRYDALRDVVGSIPMTADKCSKFLLATSPSYGPVLPFFGL